VSPTAEHVPITRFFGAGGVDSVQLEAPWSSDENLLRGVCPAPIVARDSAFGGKGRLRKRAKSLVALDAGYDLVVRRSLAQKALVGVSEADLALVPVHLVDAQGLIDDDFALLDARPWFPMDRDASDADYADPANPHGSECKLVRRLAWGQGRAPRADAFRLGEHPDVTLLRRDLAVALSKALKKALWPTSITFSP
jgi:hypothetical protein